VIVEAHAKLNLTLEVLGKRPDGYHEIRSVMRSLALHDVLEVEPSSTVEVICDAEGLSGKSNLAFRAAELLRARTGVSDGARIVLRKFIPIAAGLGGGSSDAAATLKALNRLWQTRVSAGELTRIAADLGSDVPFCLRGGSALAGGRGETLEQLPDQADCQIVLVNPGFGVSTADVYRGVTSAMYTVGEASERFAGMPPGAPISTWPLVNALHPVTISLYPEVAEVLEYMQAWGAVQAQMCGSGPTCFGLFLEPARATAAVHAAATHRWQAWHTHFA
jgi:4-diphosphocytidyl-2-C-methyl-D-erythritol kinase